MKKVENRRNVLKEDMGLIYETKGKIIFSKVKKFCETPLLMIAPAIIVLFGVALYSMFYLLYNSFFSFNLLSGIRNFIGFENYYGHISDTEFWMSLKTSFIYIIIAMSGSIFLGFCLALVVESELKKKKFGNILTFIFIIPSILPPVLASLIWKWLYDPSFGLINYFLGFLHIQGRAWLSDPTTAIFSIAVVDIWQWTPFVFLIFLAGLKSIPETPIESAQIDGATRFQIIRHIILPLLNPIIVIILLLRFIDTFRMFDYVYALTQGGPGNVTDVLSMRIYRSSFRYLEIGEAASAGWLMIIIMIFVSTYILRKLYKNI